MPAPRLACPAAQPIQPVDDAPSVLCGVLRLANEGQSIRGFTERAEADPVLSGSRMAATVENFCGGPGIPGSRCSYTSCVIWRAQREADWARRRGPSALRDEQAARPPTVDPELREALSLTVGG